MGKLYWFLAMETMERDKETIAASQPLINSLWREIRKLRQKLHETHWECARKLETSRTETERLQERLVEMAEREKDVEIQRLRAQLSATVRVCQELLEHRSPLTEQESESSAASHLGVCLSSLREENHQLRKRVIYVESLNSRWQMYDSSRERYVRGLGQKLKEDGGLASLQLEISRLSGLLRDKTEECERLGGERRNHQEHIQMLEQQILAYVEDFRSERSDRERAQGRIQDLQEEVARLRLEIRPQEPTPSRRTRAGLKKPPDRLTDTLEPLRTSASDLQTRRNLGGSRDLQCPLCLATYHDQHMAEYLLHLDECAKL